MDSREQARNYFKEKELTYEDISMDDIYYLISILNKKIFDDNILIMMNEPKIKGKDITLYFLEFSFLKVKGNYFADREAITFNEDGFIGFCGWADLKRTSIFTTGFMEWCDYLVGKKVKS